MSAPRILLLLALLWPGYPARAADTPAPPDRNGDPLPPGAVARLGTLRFHHGDGAVAVAYSPDGKTLASGGYGDSEVRLWEAKTGEAVFKLSNHRGYVEALAFSPDGKLLASAGHDRTVRLWEPTAGKELHHFEAALGKNNNTA